MANYNSDKRIDQLDIAPPVTDDSELIVGGPAGKAFKIKRKNLGLQKKGVVFEFESDDWTLNVDKYEIVLEHSLNSEKVSVSILDNGAIIAVDQVSVIDNNSVLLSVPANPDLRFTGSATVTGN